MDNWKDTHTHTLIRAHLLTGVSKCVTGDEDLAGGPGLGLTPQGLMTVCTASWGLNPPSHRSLGTLRYLHTRSDLREHAQEEGLFIQRNRKERLALPCCQQLILLSVQTQLQGFICSAALPHTLWGVRVTIVTVVAVEKDRGEGFPRESFSALPWAKTRSRTS